MIETTERGVAGILGYIKASPTQLDADTFSYYQGIYCSLCKQLGRRYGLAARFTLSYDFTFFAAFRMALSAEPCEFSPCHCSFSPFCHRLSCSREDVLAQTADVAILLTYYQLQDAVADNRSLKKVVSRLLRWTARHWQRKAAKRQPDIDRYIAHYMETQAQREAENTGSLDSAADPFACFLAALLAPSEEPYSPLWRFGYCLGRWIYLADAVEDLPHDLRRRNYNPFIRLYGLESNVSPARIQEIQQQGLLTLNNCLAECKAAYDQLTIHRWNSLFRNILYAGMPAVQQDLLLSPKERRCAAKQRRKTIRNTTKKEA